MIKHLLENFTESIMSKLGSVLPDIVFAILILIIGLILASLLKKLVKVIIRKSGLEAKVEKKVDPKSFRLDNFLSMLVYYLAVIYVLILVLNFMGVESALAPLTDMLNSFLAFIPNILAAGIILYAGYILAKLAAAAVTALAGGLTSFSEKMGLNNSINLSSILGQVVFLVIFIPIAIVALDTLNLDVISNPAENMLTDLLSAIPRIIAAALILLIFFISGRFVSAAIQKLLDGFNLDNFSKKMYLDKVIGTNNSMSKIIGNIVFFFIVFSGIIAAIEKLEFNSLSVLLTDLLDLSGSILLGLVVFAIGNFLAQLAYKSLSENDKNKWVAKIARFAIWGLFISIGLNTMGIGEEIVNLAFMLSLGAAAIAFALAFGLGGREPARKIMDRWFNSKNDKPLK